MDIKQFSNGQFYAVTGGQIAHTTGTAVTYALSVFNPANSGKGFYIYDLDVEDNAGLPILTVYQNLNASDPAYANAMTALNLGGFSNQPSVCNITNSGLLATFTPPGNPILTALVGSKSYNPMLWWGSGFHLPPSTVGNGYIISFAIGSAVGTGISYVNFRYGEY